MKTLKLLHSRANNNKHNPYKWLVTALLSSNLLPIYEFCRPAITSVPNSVKFLIKVFFAVLNFLKNNCLSNISVFFIWNYYSVNLELMCPQRLCLINCMNWCLLGFKIFIFSVCTLVMENSHEDNWHQTYRDNRTPERK